MIARLQKGKIHDETRRVFPDELARDCPAPDVRVAEIVIIQD
jgi:hypothetical protein